MNQTKIVKLLEEFRKLAFWSLDTLKGRPIGRHFHEICTVLNQEVTTDQAKLQDLYLKKLLNYVTTHCEFYFKFQGLPDLIGFPIVNKNLIKANEEQFISKDYNIKNIHSVTTSGSTGTPFKTYQDKVKKNRNYADTLYFAKLAGYELGHRLIYLKIWVEKKMHSRSAYWFQNIIPVDVIRLDDREIERLLNRMEKDNSTFGIIGYASALEMICQYLDRKKSGLQKARVKSVIAISETLNDYTRSAVFQYFGIPVVSRYSNLENGIIAQQEMGDSGKFLINSASYYVEILKIESDEPALEGELGRIVITDLFNYAMPMIRYDTGDVGAVECDPRNRNRKYFSKVEGRKLDLLYDTGGNLVSSYIVYKNMWQYTEIDQYQLIQEGLKEYRFKINTKSTFRKEDQLIEEFKSFLGRDAIFRIEYVSELPLLASGKRKKIVNHYYKDILEDNDIR